MKSHFSNDLNSIFRVILESDTIFLTAVNRNRIFIQLSPNISSIGHVMNEHRVFFFHFYFFKSILIVMTFRHVHFWVNAAI